MQKAVANGLEQQIEKIEDLPVINPWQAPKRRLFIYVEDDSLGPRTA